MASLTICCCLSTSSPLFLNINVTCFRSKSFNSDGEDRGGETFVLLAFVSDVQQDVEEGMDGIEHMSDIDILFIVHTETFYLLFVHYRMCGHRHAGEVKLDERSFGFPFDRNIGFKLEDNSLK